MTALANMTSEEFREFFARLPDGERRHYLTQWFLIKEYQSLSPETLKQQRVAYRKAISKAIENGIGFVSYTDINEEFWSTEPPEKFLYWFEYHNQLKLIRIIAKVPSEWRALDENGELYTNESKYGTFFVLLFGADFKKYKLSVGIINQM